MPLSLTPVLAVVFEHVGLPGGEAEVWLLVPILGSSLRCGWLSATGTSPGVVTVFPALQFSPTSCPPHLHQNHEPRDGGHWAQDAGETRTKIHEHRSLIPLHMLSFNWWCRILRLWEAISGLRSLREALCWGIPCCVMRSVENIYHTIHDRTVTNPRLGYFRGTKKQQIRIRGS